MENERRGSSVGFQNVYLQDTRTLIDCLEEVKQLKKKSRSLVQQ